MMFLLKTIFWLSVVVFLLPNEPGNGHVKRGDDVHHGAALSAAAAAASEIGKLCSSEDEACAAGAQAAASWSERLQSGGAFVLGLLRDRLGVAATETLAESRALAKPSQHTLKASDAGPAWRGPVRDAKKRAPDRIASF